MPVRFRCFLLQYVTSNGSTMPSHFHFGPSRYLTKHIIGTLREPRCVLAGSFNAAWHQCSAYNLHDNDESADYVQCISVRYDVSLCKALVSVMISVQAMCYALMHHSSDVSKVDGQLPIPRWISRKGHEISSVRHGATLTDR